MAHPPVLSPVDYDAWSRGYLPPSEHILIDALQFRGAKIMCSSSVGGASWWLVTNNANLTRLQRRQVTFTLLNMDWDEPAPARETLEAAFCLNGPYPDALAEGAG